MATEVKAQISGVVFRIDAKLGDRVGEGSTVITLESMKMEMAVEAPAAGKVSAIKVAEGDFVEEGQVVAVLD